VRFFVLLHREHQRVATVDNLAAIQTGCGGEKSCPMVEVIDNLKWNTQQPSGTG
jgi:hypothetical protein